jgi:hypothetical protein
MTRLTYYRILFFGLGFIFIYLLLGLISFLLFNIHLPKPYFETFLDLFFLFILLYETFDAQRKIFWSCALLMVLTLFGRLFMIMHWPYGLTLFGGSVVLIAIILAFNTIRLKADTKLRLAILLYLLTQRLVLYFIFRMRLPWLLIDMTIIAIMLPFLGQRLYRHKES